PESRDNFKMRQRRADLVGKFRGNDEMLRLDDINAVGERQAHQIGIEQRDYAAHLSNTCPYGQILGPVWHEQPYRLPLADSLRKGPSGISVGPFGEGPVRQALPLREQGRRAGEFCRTLIKHIRKDTILLPRNRGGHLDRTYPGLGDGGPAVPLFLCAGVCHAVAPASTVRTVPVILFDLHPRRNSTALATSSISARRLSALRRAICCRCSSFRPWVISVSMKPGATAFTLMPMRPTSRARDRVKPISDALVAP